MTGQGFNTRFPPMCGLTPLLLLVWLCVGKESSMKMRVEGALDFMPWERAYGLLAKV
jgi:hypothetical protein